METLYIRNKNKRFKKWGTTCSHDIFWDGLWLCQIHDGSTEWNNVLHRVADLPNPVDIVQYIKGFMCKDAIIRALKNTSGKSLSDTADEIAKEIYLEWGKKKGGKKK
jgi:hypothetical protein